MVSNDYYRLFSYRMTLTTTFNQIPTPSTFNKKVTETFTAHVDNSR